MRIGGPARAWLMVAEAALTPANAWSLLFGGACILSPVVISSAEMDLARSWSSGGSMCTILFIMSARPEALPPPAPPRAASSCDGSVGAGGGAGGAGARSTGAATSANGSGKDAARLAPLCFIEARNGHNSTVGLAPVSTFPAMTSQSWTVLPLTSIRSRPVASSPDADFLLNARRKGRTTASSSGFVRSLSFSVSFSVTSEHVTFTLRSAIEL